MVTVPRTEHAVSESAFRWQMTDARALSRWRSRPEESSSLSVSVLPVMLNKTCCFWKQNTNTLWFVFFQLK